MARLMIKCMLTYSRAVMIAHDKEHTERLLQKAHLLLGLMRGPKPELGRANDQEIFFKKTGATFFIGTAGAKNFGRSDTITDLHCSEFAFWKDPRNQAMGLFQAVPHDSGMIVKECTANGYGTYHHRQFLKAQKGEGKFRARFYPWYIFAEYTSSLPLVYPPTQEEIELIDLYNLSMGQIQWRREKISEDFDGDIQLFKQEYPATVEEAFLVSGGSLFPTLRYLESDRWKRGDSPLASGRLEYLEGHPNKDYHYVFGIDSSGGTGGDYSTIECVCVETLEEVMSYATNTLPPPRFAEVVAELGERWNGAYLVPEANQHGLSLISCIREHGIYADSMGRIYREPKRLVTSTIGLGDNTYGFRTTQASKYRLIGVLQKFIQILTVYCFDTAEEVRGYGEDDKGKLSNIETRNDDRVIALALACLGVLKLNARGIGIIPEDPEDTLRDWKPGEFTVSLEDIQDSIKRVHSRGSGFYKSL